MGLVGIETGPGRMCSKKSKKWQGMLQQGIYLLLERRHALCRHSVAQEIQLLGPEFALFAVDDQATRGAGAGAGAGDAAYVMPGLGCPR